MFGVCATHSIAVLYKILLNTISSQLGTKDAGTGDAGWELSRAIDLPSGFSS